MSVVSPHSGREAAVVILKMRKLRHKEEKGLALPSGTQRPGHG